MVKRRRKFSVKPFTKGLRGPGAEPMAAFRRKRNLLSVQALFGVNCRRRRQEGPFSRRKAPVEVAERRCCGRIRTAPVKTGTAYATNVPLARLLHAAALRPNLSLAYPPALLESWEISHSAECDPGALPPGPPQAFCKRLDRKLSNARFSKSGREAPRLVPHQPRRFAP